jgi:hypothetical protein
MQENERFENYLREFEPRRPKPLPSAIDSRLDWRRLAAAAAVFFALGASTWIGFQKHQPHLALRVVSRPPVRPSVLQLTQMAVDDPLKLDAELTEESRRVLPNFQSKESTLHVLSKQ